MRRRGKEGGRRRKEEGREEGVERKGGTKGEEREDRREGEGEGGRDRTGTWKGTRGCETSQSGSGSGTEESVGSWWGAGGRCLPRREKSRERFPGGRKGPVECLPSQEVEKTQFLFVGGGSRRGPADGAGDGPQRVSCSGLLDRRRSDQECQVVILRSVRSPSPCRVSVDGRGERASVDSGLAWLPRPRTRRGSLALQVRVFMWAVVDVVVSKQVAWCSPTPRDPHLLVHPYSDLNVRLETRGNSGAGQDRHSRPVRSRGTRREEDRLPPSIVVVVRPNATPDLSVRVLRRVSSTYPLSRVPLRYVGGFSPSLGGSFSVR